MYYCAYYFRFSFANVIGSYYWSAQHYNNFFIRHFLLGLKVINMALWSPKTLFCTVPGVGMRMCKLLEIA
jgi:hypothetical protein